jgi:hypothetical protein
MSVWRNQMNTQLTLVKIAVATKNSPLWIFEVRHGFENNVFWMANHPLWKYYLLEVEEDLYGG